MHSGTPVHFSLPIINNTYFWGIQNIYKLKWKIITKKSHCILALYRLILILIYNFPSHFKCLLNIIYYIESFLFHSYLPMKGLFSLWKYNNAKIKDIELMKQTLTIDKKVRHYLFWIHCQQIPTMVILFTVSIAALESIIW